MNRLPEKTVLAVFVAAAGVMTVLGQLPIPVPGQNPAQGGAQAGTPGGGRAGRGGRGAQPAAAEPVKQVVTPIPAAVEVTGPGEFYETFMDDHDDATKTDVPAKDTYARFSYEAKEYFISGTMSGGMRYKTRIVIR